MIERKFVSEKYKEFAIEEFITSTLKNVGHSHTQVTRTPLGERIMIFASRPGLVVGRKGENIKKLTGVLKKRFGLENPQIEITQVDLPDLDAQIVAERIASTLERFGIKRFKAVGHKTLDNVMRSGALGVEILISGKVPSTRARTWRFYKGYLKKSGEIAVTGVRKAYAVARLKSGVVGVRVMILTSDVQRPDDVEIVAGVETSEEVTEDVVEKTEEKPAKKKTAPRKRKAKKTVKTEPKVASETGAQTEAAQKETPEHAVAEKETKETEEAKDAKEAKQTGQESPDTKNTSPKITEDKAE